MMLESNTNILDKIKDLAKKEAKKLYIYENLRDCPLDSHLPLFQICGSNIKVGCFKKHDNAPRMMFWANYLKNYVLPVQKSGSLDGFYNIELHDSYTHLKDVMKARTSGFGNANSYHLNKYKNCLVWSKDRNDEDVVLLPDIYHIANFGNRLQMHKDSYLWDQKCDKIGFWGTTTGNTDPLMNDRIQTCEWFYKQDPRHLISDCYITKIAQMKPHDILEQCPLFPHIFKEPVSIPYQYKYKFLLDIPGNTCSWDRVPLIMNSNSLLFKMPCQDMCFYYPLLKENEHFVQVDKNDVLKKREYYLNNPKEAQFIISNARSFSQTVFTSETARLYINELFREAANLRALT